MIKDFMKKHRCLILALMIVIAVFLPYILFNDHLFIFAGDSYEQQVKMYMQAWCRLRDGSLPFWDWSNFLGNNYFGASTFYFLGSPFFWLVMLLPDVELVPYAFLTINIIKSIFCVLFGYLWLYRVTKSDLGASAGSLMITFSGFVLINYTNNHMLDAVLFMPLVLYFTEKYFQDKKILGIVISVGMLGIVSYYFLYLFIPFLCLYTLIRYFVVTEDIQFKTLMKDASVFIIAMLLGVGVSCITLLPSFLALQGNPRSAEMGIGLNTVGKTNLFRFITSFINPVNDWRQNANFFVSTTIDPGIGWCGGMTNYSLILSVFLMIPLLGIKNLKEKAGIILLYFLYVIFAIFPMFYVLFNQNYESRWMVVITLLNALMSATVLSKRKEIKKGYYLLSTIAVILVMAGCLFASIKLGFVFEFWEVDILKRNVLILSIVLAAYGMLFFYQDKLSSLVLKLTVMSLLLFEVGFSFYNCFYNLDETNHPMSQQTLDDLHLLDMEITDYIKEQDTGFYRVDIATVYPLSFNDAFAKRYHSFNVYHSVYNYRQSEFILGRFNGSGSWIFNPQKGKTLLKGMLGSKYWFSFGGIEADYRSQLTYGHEDIPPYGYTLMNTIDDIEIYKNDYPVSFAYAAENQIAKEDFLELSQYEQDRLLLNSVVVDKKIDSEIQYIDQPVLLKPIGDETSQFDLYDKTGTITLVFESNKYNGYRFYDNNQQVIASGALTREMRYTTINIPEGSVLFEVDNSKNLEVYYDSMEWMESWYNALNEVMAKDVLWTDNSILGTVSLNKEGMIVTSVPFDQGWIVKLDGKEVDYEMVNLGFVGFEADAGEHFIEMYYVPPGLMAGVFVSIGCLATAAVLQYLLGKKSSLKK